MCRTLTLTICLTLLANFGFLNSVACRSRPPKPTSDTPTGTIIPLYLYPAVQNNVHNWQPLIDAHSANGIEVWAIVNVNSGPSDQIDENYRDAIQRLKNAGINTLGYVSTNYTVRSADLVKKDIDTWKTYYEPKGIFFDEMTAINNANYLNYYKDLRTYANGKGFTYTVGNPGTDVDLNYAGVFDTIMIVEDDKGFPSQTRICRNYQNYPRRQWGIFPYNIQSLNESQVREAKACVGFIYVTNDGGNNPWDTLPPYLVQLFQILK